jgi:TatA/E family protein of Tat protein translocase
MPQIGPLELMVVAVIALVVFGPRRLPEMARSVGKAMNEFKRQAADLKGQFDAADLLDEPVSADAPPGPGTVVPEPAGAVGAVEAVVPEPASAVGAVEAVPETASALGTIEVVRESVPSASAVEVAPELEADPVVDGSSTQPIQTTNQ